MSDPTKKQKRSNAMTIRFTDEEFGFLIWYSDRIDCDRANAPRHILASFITDHSELYSAYIQDTQDLQTQEETTMKTQYETPLTDPDHTTQLVEMHKAADAALEKQLKDPGYIDHIEGIVEAHEKEQEARGNHYE